jgi:hypothetical protein
MGFSNKTSCFSAGSWYCVICSCMNAHGQ